MRTRDALKAALDERDDEAAKDAYVAAVGWLERLAGYCGLPSDDATLLELADAVVRHSAQGALGSGEPSQDQIGPIVRAHLDGPRGGLTLADEFEACLVETFQVGVAEAATLVVQPRHANYVDVHAVRINAVATLAPALEQRITVEQIETNGLLHLEGPRPSDWFAAGPGHAVRLQLRNLVMPTRPVYVRVSNANPWRVTVTVELFGDPHVTYPAPALPPYAGAPPWRRGVKV
jgi:hypothetical protein